MKVKVHIKLKSVLSLFCLEWCGGKRGRVKNACSKVTPHSPGNKRLVYPGMFQSIFTIMSWSTLHAAFLLSFCSQIHCGQCWFEPGAAVKKKQKTQPCLLRQFHCFISLFVLLRRSEGWALMRLSHSWSSTTRKGPRSWKRFEAACSPFAAGRVSLMKWGTAVTNTF